MRTRKTIVTILAIAALLITCMQVSVQAAPSENQELRIRFIDVGQGDAALIQCEGESMLIDGGPPEASSIIYSTLRKNQVNKLKYIVATHPDSDHIGGLSGALNYATTKKCFCSVKEHDAKPFESLKKYLRKQNVFITVPKAGDKVKLGSAVVTFLGPLNDSGDTNNNSLVVRLEYGNNSFIFMGDAETAEEAQILERWKDLKSDVIKIGHHGSESSTSKELLDGVQPKYAIVSVGQDNSYGHPVQSILDRLESAKTTIYRTDLQGDITIVSDGSRLAVYTEKYNTTVHVKIPTESAYVLNISSGKFHVPTCDGVKDMKPKNRQDTTKSREELMDEGYTPCKLCNP